MLSSSLGSLWQVDLEVGYFFERKKYEFIKMWIAGGQDNPEIALTQLNFPPLDHTFFLFYLGFLESSIVSDVEWHHFGCIVAEIAFWWSHTSSWNMMTHRFIAYFEIIHWLLNLTTIHSMQIFANSIFILLFHIGATTKTTMKKLLSSRPRKRHMSLLTY